MNLPTVSQLLVLGLVPLLLAKTAWGGVVLWNQTTSGTFDLASSWEDSVKPGSNDVAVFTGTNTTAGVGDEVLFLDSQDVKAAWFSSGGYELVFGNPAIAFSLSLLVLGGSDHENITGEFTSVSSNRPPFAALTLRTPLATFPALVETSDLEIGPPPFAHETIRPALLRIEGPGNFWRNRGAGAFDGNLFVGGAGNEGTLVVAGGAHFENESAVFLGGPYARAAEKPDFEIGAGNLIVEGAGSEFTADWILVGSGFGFPTTNYSGYSSRGQLVVSNAATLQTSHLKVGAHQKESLSQTGDFASVFVNNDGQLRIQHSLALEDTETLLSVTTNAGAPLDPHAGAVIIGDAPQHDFVAGAIKVIGGGAIWGGGSLRGNVHMGSNSWISLMTGYMPRTLKIEGNLLGEVEANIYMRVRGYLTNEHSVIQITQNAQLAGTVTVVFTNGFVPVVGDMFPIFQAGGSLILSNATLHVISETPQVKITALLDANGRLEITEVRRPARLSIAVHQGDVVVRWDTNGQLQNASTASGVWNNVTNASNPFRIPPVGNCFFRVVD